MAFAASAADVKNTGVYRAQLLVDQGNELLSRCWPPWEKDDRKEEAIELYNLAATIYKVAKEWKLAANCYLEVRRVADTLPNSLESSLACGNAGRCFRNANDVERASDLFGQCARRHVLDNRMHQAGKMFRLQAETDQKHSLEAYQLAEECFFTVDSLSADGNECEIKIAEILTNEGQFSDALKHYTSVIEKSLTSAQRSYAVTGHMFNALLCRFCDSTPRPHDDIVHEMTTELENCKLLNPAFDSTRECKLIFTLISGQNLKQATLDYNRIKSMTILQSKLVNIIIDRLNLATPVPILTATACDDMQSDHKSVVNLQN